jgi:hypothetical protein
MGSHLGGVSEYCSRELSSARAMVGPHSCRCRPGVPCGCAGPVALGRTLLGLPLPVPAVAQSLPGVPWPGPGVAGSPVADAVAFGDVDLRLVRRVVEIRDGRLALRTYLPAGTVAGVRSACEAAGLTPQDTQATIEAASLAAALRQHSRGEVVEATDSFPETPGGTDLDQEVACLVRVAQAYAGSPIGRIAHGSLHARPRRSRRWPDARRPRCRPHQTWISPGPSHHGGPRACACRRRPVGPRRTGPAPLLHLMPFDPEQEGEDLPETPGPGETARGISAPGGRDYTDGAVNGAAGPTAERILNAVFEVSGISVDRLRGSRQFRRISSRRSRPGETVGRSRGADASAPRTGG